MGFKRIFIAFVMFRIRWLLIPFSWLYSLVVQIRNFLFDIGAFHSKSYPVAVLGIGNIRAGGTGKSPFTEFLIRLLYLHYQVATLSRGYGRKTKGFLIVDSPEASQYGDEPSQFKAKYPEITVAVSEDRILALDKLTIDHQVILMDDSYQHRKVNAGQYWVLIEYEDLAKPFILFPAGNYREGISGLNRAKAILITKCTDLISMEEENNIRIQLRLKPEQFLFFSAINYLSPQRVGSRIQESSRPLFTSMDPNIDPREGSEYKAEEISPHENLLSHVDAILVVTGIARNTSLKTYLSSFACQKIYMPFSDHHDFSRKDIKKMEALFSDIKSSSKIILTTEKDAQRLLSNSFRNFIQEYPVYFLPIEFIILNNSEKEVKELVLQYVHSIS